MTADRDGPQGDRRPLEGRTVVVTRPRDQADPLTRALRDRGARVVEYPTIRIRPPGEAAPLRRALERLEVYDWAVFTSVNGVRHVLEELEALGRDREAFEGVRLAAIGPSTAGSLEEAGLAVDVVPGEYRAEALADALRRAGAADGARVLLARAAEARDVLRERLEEAGAAVDEVTAYETAPGRPEEGDLEGRMREGEIDWLTFTASSTVRNFVRMAGTRIGPARVACIGPITARTARELGLPVHAVAEEYTVPGLVRALTDAERVRGGG